MCLACSTIPNRSTNVPGMNLWAQHAALSIAYRSVPVLQHSAQPAAPPREDLSKPAECGGQWLGFPLHGLAPASGCDAPADCTEWNMIVLCEGAAQHYACSARLLASLQAARGRLQLSQEEAEGFAEPQHCLRWLTCCFICICNVLINNCPAIQLWLEKRQPRDADLNTMVWSV